MYLLVPTGTGETPRVVTTPPLIYIIGGVILGFMVLVILVAVALASGGLLIRRLVFLYADISECTLECI